MLLELLQTDCLIYLNLAPGCFITDISPGIELDSAYLFV